MDLTEAKAALISSADLPVCEHKEATYGDTVRCTSCGAELVDGVWRGPLGPMDEAADALIVRVGRFFGECAGGDTFCGLSIDETRNEAGILTSLKLVACDMVSGEPVRREGKFREPVLEIAPADSKVLQ